MSGTAARFCGSMAPVRRGRVDSEKRDIHDSAGILAVTPPGSDSAPKPTTGEPSARPRPCSRRPWRWGRAGSRASGRLSGYCDSSQPDSHHQDSTTNRVLRGWSAGGVGESVARLSNGARWAAPLSGFWPNRTAHGQGFDRADSGLRHQGLLGQLMGVPVAVQSGDLGPNYGCPGSHY